MNFCIQSVYIIYIFLFIIIINDCLYTKELIVHLLFIFTTLANDYNYVYNNYTILILYYFIFDSRFV